ncbi:integrase [Bacteroides fragilis]|nr:integrase [Bacteroides fragilis]
MNSEYKSALFLSIKIGYLSSFQKQAANSLVTETLQYFVFFCRPAYSAILVKCLIINVLRFILAIPFFTAFLNITYVARHTWATTAFRQKVPIGLIANAMGHSSVKVTETYLKPFEEEELNRVNEGIIKYTMGQMNAAV